MDAKKTKDRHVFEIMLVIVSVGMTYLLFQLGGYKMVALNLFFLPIVLSGYYLGRTSAGVLAVFCALAVTIATVLDSSGFAAYTSPITVGLALTVWAAVLGLTAILVGTLCDERGAKIEELQEAYFGVVEVLSRYLQSGHPTVKAKSVRVAELCQLVAEDLRMSRKQIDDVRVGALLHDLGSVEITTKLIRKAVTSLEADAGGVDKHTFLGADLVHSLGSVLHGAVPLAVGQTDLVRDVAELEQGLDAAEVPLGARIIRAVHAYDELVVSGSGEPVRAPADVLEELRNDDSGEFAPDVLNAIERVVKNANTPVREPSLV